MFLWRVFLKILTLLHSQPRFNEGIQGSVAWACVLVKSPSDDDWGWDPSPWLMSQVLTMWGTLIAEFSWKSLFVCQMLEVRPIIFLSSESNMVEMEKSGTSGHFFTQCFSVTLSMFGGIHQWSRLALRFSLLGGFTGLFDSFTCLKLCWLVLRLLNTN